MNREKYIIKEIIEDDFGCEGRGDNEPAMITVVLEKADGSLISVRMADEDAYARNLTEKSDVIFDENNILMLAK